MSRVEVAHEHGVPSDGLEEIGRPGPRFLAWFVPIFVLLGVFAIATPLWANADEPSQVTQAAAVVRGQLHGRLIPYGALGFPNEKLLVTQVTVPASLAISAPHPFPCFQRGTKPSAGCAASPVNLSGDLPRGCP